MMNKKYRGCFEYLGNVHHDELAKLYCSADVFVFPSLAEGSALVTYEALASGLPCVVTRETGSVVRDGIEGFVVPSGDAFALRERIRRLYEDEHLRHCMAAAARQRAEEFSWKRYHERMAEAIDRIVLSGGQDA